MKEKIKASTRKDGVQGRARQTVNVIMEATAQLLLEKGLAKLSTNKIVERAGVSIGTLYQYFPSKESIYHKLLETQFNKNNERVLSELEAIDFSQVDLKSAISQLVDTFLIPYSEKRKMHQILLQSIFSVEQMRFMQKNDQLIADKIKEKFQLKWQLSNEEWDRYLFIIIYAAKGIQFGHLFHSKEITKEQLKNDLVELIYNFLQKKFIP